MALALVRMTESALDVWWLLSGVLGAAIVGLFLLGLIVPAIRNRGAIYVLIVGMILIGWMTISKTNYWPTAWSGFASPFHPLLVIVLGPCLMIVLGWMFSRERRVTS